MPRPAPLSAARCTAGWRSTASATASIDGLARRRVERGRFAMNLSTTYLGMTLHSPLVVSASPLSESIPNIKQMEAAGAGAVVLYSLFEEQVRREQEVRDFSRIHPAASQAILQDLFPAYPFRANLDDYLEHVRNAKRAV